MLGRDWLLIAALGGCLSLGAWAPWTLKPDAPQSASGEAKPEATKGDQPAEAADAPSETAPPPVEAEIAAQATQSGAKGDEAKKAEKEIPWTEWWVAVSTIVMAVFTGILTGVGIFQIWLLLRSNSETRDALCISRDAADAAKMSAEAAAAANEITRDAAQRQTRAYISITHFTLKPLEVGKLIQVGLQVENLGATPAHIEHSLCGVCSGPYPDHPLPTVETQIYAPTLSRPVLGKNVQFFPTGHSGAPLTPNALAAIESGKHAVYCWGEIKYRDVYGAVRFTRWKAFAGGTFGIRGTSMCPSEDGNEAT